MNQTGLFSSYYLAPIEYYYYLTQYNHVIEDIHEHFVKQTYRSRCYIIGPNGIQSLSIPLINIKRQQKFKDVKISYAENWQKIHWKSIEAAYRRSPYFEFYEDSFFPFYNNSFKFLIDFNQQLQEKITALLGITPNIQLTEKYQSTDNLIDDYRITFSPKNELARLKFPEYIQVFNDRNDFAANLSIVDLLFNEGPNSVNYIKSIAPDV